MTSTETSRRSTARTTQVVGLLLAAIGLVVLILTGVSGFPLIPPGLVIPLVAAGLVAFLPWRWVPVLGVLAAGFLAVGAVASGATGAMLARPAELGPFLGSTIQVVGLAIAIVAGVAALVSRRA